MKKSIFVCLLMLCGLFSITKSLWAQKIPYYFNSKNSYLELDAERLAIKYQNDKTTNVSLKLAGTLNLESVSSKSTGLRNFKLIRLEKDPISKSDVNLNIEKVIDLPEVSFASPVFFNKDSSLTILTTDILVRVKSEYITSINDIFSQFPENIQIIEKKFGSMPGVYKLRIICKNGFKVLSIANKLSEDARIEWAEPDVICVGQTDAMPNDEGFPNLWGLRNTGQLGGIKDMDMDADFAWNITKGSTDIKVLILDCGIQQDHPDINQLQGKDFTGESGDGGPINQWDNHGTAVAGCVSAIIDNSIGSVGIAPESPVLSARVLITNSDGHTVTSQPSWIIEALTWAEEEGVRITNASFCYGFESNALEDKYKSTYDAGMIHFASAGNDGSSEIGFPASISCVNAVASITPGGVLASFSNFGDGLAFSAPGVSIYTTDRTGVNGYIPQDYSYIDGTSFASPYAAGVAALVLSQNPNLSAEEVEAKLQASCKDLGEIGYDTTFGWGCINAFSALGGIKFEDIYKADLNDDWIIDKVDSTLLKGCWNTDGINCTGQTCSSYKYADLDNSGMVDSIDLYLLRQNMDSIVPAAVELSVTRNSNSIKLIWKDVSCSEDYFFIERMQDGDGSWEKIDSVNMNIVSYEDTNIKSDKEYTYRVYAYCEDTNRPVNFSSYSNQATVFPLSAQTPWPMFMNNAQHTGQSQYKGPEQPHIKWTYTTGYNITKSSPIIGIDGAIYIGSDDNRFYAINPDGTLKWRYLTNNDVYGSAAIGADGTIYWASTDLKLYALNPDGTIKWTFSSLASFGIGFYTSPVIDSNGVIYIGDSDYLYAINSNGSLKWAHQTDAVYSSPVIGYDGTIYVGCFSQKIIAINPDGTLKWYFQTNAGIRSSPSIGTDGTIYIGSEDWNLYALNPDGTLKWIFTTEWQIISSPTIGSDGTIYIGGGSGDHKMYAINPDGSLKWTYKTENWIKTAPAIDANQNIYFGCDDMKFYAVDSTGALKWSIETGETITSSPAIGSDGTIYFGSGDRKLYAIGESGVPLSEVPALVYPVNNQVDTPLSVELKWNQSLNAATYDLQVAYDALFTEMMIDTKGITDTTYLLSNLSYNDSYYWRVAAANQSGTSDWSEVWSFETVDDNATNTELNADNQTIKIYPNPTTGKLTVKGKHINSISIYDNIGSLIKRMDNKTDLFVINLKDQVPGIYFIKLAVKDKIITEKIILK